jgi:ATP-binding cassette, subfamily B, multidrug efflux pump
VLDSPTTTSIFSRARAELGSILGGFVCLAVTGALALAIPWLIKDAVDTLRTSPAAEAHGVVVRDAIAIIACAVLQALIRTWSRILVFNAGRNIEYRLRRDLFAHLARLDPRFYRTHGTGDVMSRMTNDLSAVRMMFGPGLLNLFNTAFVYATTLVVLVKLSPMLTLLALLPYPALLLGARVATRRMYKASREIAEQLGVMSSAVQEDLAGIAVIKHYTLEPSRAANFRLLADKYAERSLALVRARGAMMPLFAMLGGLGTLIVLAAGGREVIAGRMTIGGLVAFNAYLVLLSWPTVALGWIIGIWQRGVASWMRVRELLTTASGIADATDVAAAGPADVTPAIDVRDLTVAVDGRTILDRVSFSLPAGGTLAIVGPTGAGKTTLVDALVRMQEVPAGAIHIGGTDVTRMPLARLRGLVGYAPQDAFLFSATVAENIAFGISTARDRARVERAANAAGLAPDIAVLPDGYDTLVGERGITLSGGQRQRVALARALATEPRILILDDSLSSVDAETERNILTRLRPILAGRTSILISHRVAAVRDADQILVLENGRVAEQGSHDALLASGGVYATLYREQLAAEAAA